MPTGDETQASRHLVRVCKLLNVLGDSRRDTRDINSSAVDDLNLALSLLKSSNVGLGVIRIDLSDADWGKAVHSNGLVRVDCEGWRLLMREADAFREQRLEFSVRCCVASTDEIPVNEVCEVALLSTASKTSENTGSNTCDDLCANDGLDDDGTESEEGECGICK
jgi:hypothetical protein